MHMTRRMWVLSAALLAAISSAANAATDCGIQRKSFPKNWTAVDKETPLFTCRDRYIELKIFLSKNDETTAMLTVVNDKKVYRAIVDVREADAIRQQKGLYILNSENTCFVRGNYSQPAVLNFGDKSLSGPLGFLFAMNRLDEFNECDAVK
jgi:hypothetical protein